MRRQNAAIWLTVTVLILGVLPGSADGAGFSVRRVATGLNGPMYVTFPPGDQERLFVAERGGTIRIFDRTTQSLRGTPFISISDIGLSGEQGLLGLAFDPNYATNGHFYVNLVEPGGAFGNGVTHIRRYTLSGDPDVADPASATTILTYDQPATNHNGGWIGFSPSDGFLYVASGDGGGSNDPNDNGQNLSTLLGKMLRIDVTDDDFPGDADLNYAVPAGNPYADDGDANTLDEIWAYGLRNPFRAGFDSATGDLYIGDVGQNAREEVNAQPAGHPGGINYGWRLREGTIATPTGGVGGPKPQDAVDPIYDYPHGSGPTEGSSVTGGAVYRGPVSELQGQYIFGDYIFDNLWSLEFDGSDPSTHDGTNYVNFTNRTDDFVPNAGTIANMTCFGTDADGNMYITDLVDGELFMIVVIGDADFDGDVDIADLSLLADNWDASVGMTWSDGDFDDDGDVDIEDLSLLASNWEAGVPATAAHIPEPATIGILALGGVLLLGRRRRQTSPRRKPGRGAFRQRRFTGHAADRRNARTHTPS